MTNPYRRDKSKLKASGIMKSLDLKQPSLTANENKAFERVIKFLIAKQLNHY